ncbi:MAG: beta-lactamase regulating signal transducer with metallopeptidase domain [Saprospiraceae bacterium]|jgi:beta-lactamase regulating signal transducer with metallopeptidase domain
MIIYILKSTLCMAILLLFYKWTIEDVVMHKFKRAYLLGALILSILIPITPTGYAYSRVSIDPIENSTSSILIDGFTSNSEEIGPIFSLSLPTAIAIIFILISGLLFIRFSRNIISLIRKASENSSQAYHTTRLILLEEIIAPHTFLDKIYINKQDYLDGRINEKLLTHELAHADQRHSWDVIFVEFLICIFWFNPLLKIYKQCIQLNHEFLADEVVVNKYQQVKNYQYLLLDTIKNNNQISLASSINFSLTKKRLEMMTKKSTARRKNMLVLSMTPMILVLLVAFGRPVAAQTDTKTNQSKIDQNENLLRDSYFQEAIIHYTGEDGNEYVNKYSTLPKYMKDKMMPPPPSPDGQYQSHSPLKKGTIVTLKENGAIVIGGDGSIPPPPPPSAPSAPKSANKVRGAGFPPPPPPTSANAPAPPNGIIGNMPPPPPPPPIPLVKDLARQGVTIFLNGIKVKDDVAKTMYEEFDSKTMKLKTASDGTKSLHIETRE